VHDEEEDDPMVVIRPSGCQVIAAAAEPAGEVEALEERLEHDDPTEGSELLILEPELGYAAR
jgi:hypothetical protein